MGSGVVCEQELRQTGVPVPLSGDRQGTQQVVEGSIDPFTLSVASWIVWSGAGFFNAVKATKLLNQTACPGHYEYGRGHQTYKTIP